MIDPHSQSIRDRMQAAAARLARVKRIDRLADGVITLGGVGVVVSVLFIFLFILSQALPLFRSAKVARTAATTTISEAQAALVLGIDEYQRKLYGVSAAGALRVADLEGQTPPKVDVPPDLAGASFTAASRNATGSLLAAGTSDGRAGLIHLRFQPVYADGVLKDVTSESTFEPLVPVDPERRPVRLVDGREREGASAIAAVVGDREIVLLRRNAEGGEPERHVLEVGAGETVTHVRLGRLDLLAAATDRGGLYLWELGSEIRLVDNRSLAPSKVTALAFANADISLLVGDDQGGVAALFRVRLKDDDPEPVLVRAHVYAKQSAAVVELVPSVRDKSFLATGADGSMRLLHLTSERVLATFPPPEAPVHRAFIAPKSDAIVAALTDGRITTYRLDAPHPEITARISSPPPSPRRRSMARTVFPSISSTRLKLARTSVAVNSVTA